MRTLFEGLGGGCVAVAMSEDAKYVAALSVGSPQVSTSTFHIRLGVTSVWKVQFQQSRHFSVVCNELFHMVCLAQKCFSTQI